MLYNPYKERQDGTHNIKSNFQGTKNKKSKTARKNK